MPKQVVISMKENYPFGECQECTTEMTRVLVRKIYKFNQQQHQKFMQKVNILRKLKNQHMIKIQSVLEEEQSIHFFFEYVPIKLETWISNINDQFIQNFRDQLIKFSSFLANNYIIIEFKLNNIGMDQNYGAKYFLDVNFEVESSANKQKLKSNYIRQITNLFKPYIFHNNKTLNESDYTNQNEELKASSDLKKEGKYISPSASKIQSKNKQKTLEKYYKNVNVSMDFQNSNIMQEFMDILDNDGDAAPPVNTLLKKQSQKPKNTTQFQQKANHFQKRSSLQTTNLQRQIYSKKQFVQNNNAQFNLPHNSSKNIQNTKKNMNFVLNSQRQNENVKPISKAQKLVRGKSEIKNTSQVQRQSIDLQNRVKNAIQKSMDVIKKFKAIRQSFQT